MDKGSDKGVKRGEDVREHRGGGRKRTAWNSERFFGSVDGKWRVTDQKKARQKAGGSHTLRICIRSPPPVE